MIRSNDDYLRQESVLAYYLESQDFQLIFIKLWTICLRL